MFLAPLFLQLCGQRAGLGPTKSVTGWVVGPHFCFSFWASVLPTVEWDQRFVLVWPFVKRSGLDAVEGGRSLKGDS